MKNIHNYELVGLGQIDHWIFKIRKVKSVKGISHRD